MVDLSSTILVDSKQLNADDLIGGPKTLKITGIEKADEGPQPIFIHYEGESTKTFRPCKTVRRILVSLWGSDGNNYVGRSLRVYRDPKVTFGKLAVGGIRVSHLSHIEEPRTISLVVSKGRKESFRVEPLQIPEPPKCSKSVNDWVNGKVALISSCEDFASLEAATKNENYIKALERLKSADKAQYDRLMATVRAKLEELTASEDIGYLKGATAYEAPFSGEEWP